MSRRIAVAGASGFLGGHVMAEIARHSGFEAVPLNREAFCDAVTLAKRCRGCEAVVMLAGVSRASDGEMLYRENLELAAKLSAALSYNADPVRLIFGSTTHEMKNLPYHASKRDSRALFDRAAAAAGFTHIGVLMPNAFGPGGRPFYNSVVATFCFQAANGETPRVDAGAGEVRLIWAGTVAEALFALAAGDRLCPVVTLPDEFTVPVAEIADRAVRYASGERPAAGDRFGKLLQITVESYRKKCEKSVKSHLTPSERAKT